MTATLRNSDYRLAFGLNGAELCVEGGNFSVILGSTLRLGPSACRSHPVIVSRHGEPRAFTVKCLKCRTIRHSTHSPIFGSEPEPARLGPTVALQLELCRANLTAR